MRRRTGLLVCLASSIPVGGSAAWSQQVELPTPPLILEVPTPPRPFRREGATNLVYELHLTNLGNSTLLVDRAEIVAGSGKVIETLEGAGIAAALARPVPALKLTDPRMIEPGRRAVLYLWLMRREAQEVPRNLRHRVTVQSQGGSFIYATKSVEGGPTATDMTTTRVIAPPVRGGRWVMRFTSNVGAHRRALLTLSGKPRIMRRYGIDIGKMGPDGRQFRPGGTTNADMYGHDEEILAVADAVVADVQDGIPENDPNLPQPVPTSLRGAAGNLIILDLGGGAFAFYGHIKPGSIRVKRGDRVRLGEVIARIGNTGSSTGPHLQFHLMSAADPALADGMPYEFEQYRLEGLETLEQFQATEWSPDPAFPVRTIRRELPANGAVVVFPNGK